MNGITNTIQVSLRLANVPCIEYLNSDIDWYSYDELYFQIPFGYLPVSLRPACVPLRTSVVFNGIQW